MEEPAEPDIHRSKKQNQNAALKERSVKFPTRPNETLGVNATLTIGSFYPTCRAPNHKTGKRSDLWSIV
jgi:hypothetical protein